MKKVYIICLFLLLAAIVFGAGYYYSKNNMGIHEEMELIESETVPQISDMREANMGEARITNITEIIMQTYDLNNNTFEEKKINTPVEFLEMERGDLIKYMQDYLKTPSKEDKKRGLISYELVQFSKNVVVMRKTFDGYVEIKEEYFAVIENGYVTIYDKTHNTIYDYTDIQETILPENVKEQLKARLEFGNIGELYEFLETYSS